VHAQCSRLLDDSELADDATQDIFLGLIDTPYEGRQHFGSWLYIVVRNYCLNMLRRRKKEIPSDPDEPWSQLLTDPRDPEQNCEREELARLVDQVCAEHLTPREQQVIHLRYSWGLRVKQINEVLGLKNVSGARTHLATATRKLQDAFRAKFGEDGLRSLLEEG
jgi:RNA polymerase sigma factor (sigma-70 family)